MNEDEYRTSNWISVFSGLRVYLFDFSLALWFFRIVSTANLMALPILYFILYFILFVFVFNHKHNFDHSHIKIQIKSNQIKAIIKKIKINNAWNHIYKINQQHLSIIYVWLFVCTLFVDRLLDFFNTYNFIRLYHQILTWGSALFVLLEALRVSLWTNLW